MGEKSDAKLMYSIDGKEFKEIGEIPELIISHDETTSQSFYGGEMTFSYLTAKEYSVLQPLINSDALNRRYGTELSQDNKMAIRFYFNLLLLRNNWRRRHGLPMIRRGRR